MICSICKEEGYPATQLNPAEPCLCGQMAWGNPWQWDKWKGVKNYIRYWIVRKCIAIINKVTMRGYR